MIILKFQSDIEKIRKSGKLVARTIRLMSEAIVPNKTTPLMLDAIAKRIIIDEEKAIPSFLNYCVDNKNFPAASCICVNNQVVHGLPNNRILVEGDIITLDIGVCIDGWHADSAWSFPVGTISKKDQKLLNITKESLFQGIAKSKINHTVGDISYAIQRYVESNGCSIVRELVGHGIGRNLHEEPSIPNFGKANMGPKLRQGMTICIEPMVNAGQSGVLTDVDEWTIITQDGSNSAHFEHTVAITSDGPDILTLE